jgi:hypothetical protein
VKLTDPNSEKRTEQLSELTTGSKRGMVTRKIVQEAKLKFNIFVITNLLNKRNLILKIDLFCYFLCFL